jgi:hypothetical protein
MIFASGRASRLPKPGSTAAAAGSALAVSPSTLLSEAHERRLDLSTTTFDSRLAEARHRIDQAAEQLALLQARIGVAEHSLAADVAEDWATFASAVEAELRSWDIYLERLQTSVATKTWDAREQAETAIGDLRSRRIAVGELLARPGDASQEATHRVTVARDDLQRRADELSANRK